MNHQLTKETADAVSSVLEEYAEALGIPVRLEIPRGRIARTHVTPGFWLHPMAVPAGSWPFRGPRVRPTTLSTVCGFALPPGRRDAWQLEQDGRWGRALQDADGQTIGLLRQSSIYLFFDLLAQDPPLARLLTRAVLDLTLRITRPLLAALTGIDGDVLEGRVPRLRQATEVESLRAQSFWHPAPPEEEGGLTGAEAISREMRELEAGVRASARQMSRLEQRLLLADRRLAELEQHHDSTEAHAREFDRLAALPGITDVRLGDEVLYLYTDLVTVEYGARRFRLGRFRMDIHFDGRIFLRNLTDRCKSYDHPHVADGRPCLGSIQDWVKQLIARREFAAATAILLRYLHTVNASDWRNPVTCWPEVRR